MSAAYELRASYELRTVTLGVPLEVILAFLDEDTGRAAWLAVIAEGAHRSAALVRPSGPWVTRCRCEYSRNPEGSSYSYADRTEAHAALVRALCAELTTAAPEGYSIRVESRMGMDAIVLRGRTAEHTLGDVAANDEARVRAHWQGYVPAATEAAS